MKTRRILSVFLLLVLIITLGAIPMAAAADADMPVLPEDPDILAKAALLVDVDTDTVVYDKNAHQELYPASLTKVMTALLVLEAIEDGRLSMEQEITASETAFENLASDGSTAGIKPGEIMTVEHLLYCVLVVSANEACHILAEAVSGSVEAFVEEMNAEARRLGCENTHFVNSHGYHDPEHYTSAWDMYLITKAAMEYEDFMTICDTAHVVIPATNLKGERDYWTTNHLLSTWRVIGYRNKEAHGIKTGSTDAAGYCLVSSSERGSLHYVSVILGAERVEENGVGNIRSFSETTRLFNYGFENFTYQTVIEEKDPVQEVAVSLSEIDRVVVSAAEDTVVLMPKGLKPEHLKRTVTLHKEEVEAPVSAGQNMGSLDLSYDGKVYATVDLLAMHDVEASQMMIFWRDARLFLEKPIVRIVAIALVVLVLLILVWKLLLSRKRYRYGRSVGRGRSSNYRGRRRF